MGNREFIRFFEPDPTCFVFLSPWPVIGKSPTPNLLPCFFFFNSMATGHQEDLGRRLNMVSAVPVVLFGGQGSGLQEEVTHPGSPNSGLFFLFIVCCFGCCCFLVAVWSPVIWIQMLYPGPCRG